ncbi:dihydrofolate reductase family protein [Metabacillus sp. GX 13764]|uniref:dihydrofolate reductase family protein n=1 Tax=Metabacillus kandeliae TaxID=2900151 RepID=UPI001E4C5F0F|nr:dihydrofolate reductase family protein [Metabacillus kandeliae]MCD7034036.1 dihydrofolate reductase family protein [Metabacillus kandeliae]
MRETVLYIAMSLDGYIAREDGAIDWLEAAEGEGDNGYGEFMQTIDTVIMGRKTYDQVLGFDMPFPYQEQECYVFSSKKKGKDAHAVFWEGSPKELMKDLKTKEGKDIWLVGGSDLLHDCMKEGLVDRYMIAIIPVLLGKGIPLFKSGFQEQHVKLTGTKEYGQIVMLSYERLKSKPLNS